MNREQKRRVMVIKLILNIFKRITLYSYYKQKKDRKREKEERNTYVGGRETRSQYT